MEPRLQPSAPASPTSQRLSGAAPWPAAISGTVSEPANGMMTSDGSGMHADSIPINRRTPGYPCITRITCWIQTPKA
jgi:hypothetical protein